MTWEEVKGFNIIKSLSKRTENIITKVLSIGYGVVAIGLAFMCSNMGSLISVGSRLFGACMGPIYGICLVSVLLPFVNTIGAVTGLLVGQVVNMWLSMGAMMSAPSPQTLSQSVTDCSMFNMTVSPTSPMPEVKTEEVDASAIYLLSYNIYPIIGTCTTIAISVIVSLLLGGNKSLRDSDYRYFHPVAWKLYIQFHPNLRNDWHTRKKDVELKAISTTDAF